MASQLREGGCCGPLSEGDDDGGWRRRGCDAEAGLPMQGADGGGEDRTPMG